MRIEEDDLTRPVVHALLAEHLAQMRAQSPACSVHALDLGGLRAPGVSFWCAWDGAQLMGCGALKALSPVHGELKSMRTSARHLRQGAAQAILTELLNLARERGYARVSLETGSTPPFDAAIAMYRRFGFVDCGPFADYREDPFSRFMERSLART